MGQNNKEFELFTSKELPKIPRDAKTIEYIKNIVSNYFILNKKLDIENEELLDSLQISIEAYIEPETTNVESVDVTLIRILSTYKIVNLDIFIITPRGPNKLIMINSNYTHILLQIIEQYTESSLMRVNLSIRKLVNEMVALLTDREGVTRQSFGDLEISYNLRKEDKKKLIRPKNLNDISIEISSLDVPFLMDSKGDQFRDFLSSQAESTIDKWYDSHYRSDNGVTFESNLNKFIYLVSKINLNNLEMNKFTCKGFQLLDSKIRIFEFDEFIIMKSVGRLINEDGTDYRPE